MENFLAIDELRLDRECQNQPSLYLEHSRKLADARREYDDACAEYDVIVAETSRAVRANPGRYKLQDKPTEASIKEAVLLDDAVKDADKEKRVTKHAVDIRQGVVTALEHRKRALTLMVELRGQDYFSSPKVSGEGKKAVDDESKSRVRRLGQKKDDDRDSD